MCSWQNGLDDSWGGRLKRRKQEKEKGGRKAEGGSRSKKTMGFLAGSRFNMSQITSSAGCKQTNVRFLHVRSGLLSCSKAVWLHMPYELH